MDALSHVVTVALTVRVVSFLSTSPFDGRVFVVAGTLTLLSLEELVAVIKAGGGRVTSRVNKNVDVLVAGDSLRRIEKAESLGLEIWDEETLISNAPEAFVEQFAKHKNERVRRAIAGNVNMPAGLLERLATDSDWDVREAVAGNVNTPVGVLEQLANDFPWVSVSVAGNVNTPVGVLEQFATETDWPIKGGWARYSAWRRARVASNVSTPVYLLERLAMDPDWRVRRAVAGNTNTPLGVLERLSAEQNDGVRSRAMACLLAKSIDDKCGWDEEDDYDFLGEDEGEYDDDDEDWWYEWYGEDVDDGDE